MGGITDSLFGSDAEETPSQEQSASGFAALPGDLQGRFRNLATATQPIIDNPSQFFRPIDLTAQEQLAGNLISQPFTDPAAFGETLQGITQPFEQLITRNINRDFEDFFNAANAATSQAGAFGSTRQNELLGDVERARTEALSEALIAPALNLRQQGLNSLLGFGGLERNVALGQSSATPQGLQSVSSILSPLLGTSTSSGTGGFTTTADQGLLGGAAQFGGLARDVGGFVGASGGIAGIASSIGSFFSDERLKKNIKKVGEKNGLNLYEYEYLWSPQKFIGYIAQEVEKLYPKAVKEVKGFKSVNYGAINGIG